MKSVNKIAAIATSLVIALSLSSAAHAKTTRTAAVKVANHTGKTIEYINVIHKYSNDFKSSKIWKRVGANHTVSGMKVRYNTDFGTTGQDWWQVSYKLRGESVVRFTDPQNGRRVIDTVEKFAKRQVQGVADTINTSSFGIITLTGKDLLNNGSTAGFKKHLLRSKDESRGLTVHINSNNTVSFKSKTGTSNTGTRSISAIPR